MADWAAVVAMLPLFISFGSFAVFVWVARCAVASPSFRPNSSALTRLVHACVAERPAHAKRIQPIPQKEQSGAVGEQAPDSFAKDAARLALCTAGIQVSYLVWGLMQERIMTQPYGYGQDPAVPGSGERFTSSKFLVFANRFLALLVAYAAVKHQNEPTDEVPLYKFSFASVSNIFSSVSQYEALKYVSFPTQVLAKSCKMVPVMLMGYLVSQRTYKPFEYLVAVAVTAGAMIFKLYETNDAPVQNTEFIGIVLIVAYMGCDSFTSNWQSKIFTQ